MKIPLPLTSSIMLSDPLRVLPSFPPQQLLKYFKGTLNQWLRKEWEASMVHLKGKL